MTGAPNIERLRERLSWIAIRDESSEGTPNAGDIAEARRLLRVLELVFVYLDGEEWDSDTTANIAQTFTDAGFEINPPGHYEDEEE